MSTTSVVSESDWIKGISLSVLASIIGGASKLAIRKSWLMVCSEEEGTRELHVAEASTTNGTSIPSVYQVYDETTRIVNNECVPSLNGSSSATHALPKDSLDRSSVVQHAVNDRNSLPPPPPPPMRQEDFENCIGPLETTSTVQKKINWLAWTLRGSGMFGMTFLNPICCVLAMNYASPSILAPFSGLTLVWIVLLSQPLIGESPSWNQVAASSLIVIGEVIVAIFGDHTNDSGLTVLDVQNSYIYPPFLVYLVGLAFWMLLLWYWIQKGRSDSGTNKNDEILRRFAWGVSGGSITGLQNFLKDSLTIMKAARADGANDGEGSSLPWYLPLMLLLAAASAFGGLLCLTACMKRYDATYSSAMFVGSFVVSASIMSAVHYATFRHLDHVWNWFLYPLGLLVLIGGVWMLIHEQELQQQQQSSSPLDGSVELQAPLVSEDEEDSPNSSVLRASS